MTRLTVASSCKGEGIRVVSRDQAAVARVMAVGAVGKMRRCIRQCIRMTGRTVCRASSRYKTAVRWCCSMDRAPR